MDQFKFYSKQEVIERLLESVLTKTPAIFYCETDSAGIDVEAYIHEYPQLELQCIPVNDSYIIIVYQKQ